MRLLNASRLLCVFAGAALLVASRAPAQPPADDGVQIVPNEAEHRVDISIGGQPFTSYLYPDTVKKPVLFPLRTAKGTIITRGFPPGPGERADHPHHVGLWFNYSDVNGFDFWNNSDAIKPEQRPKMGTIVQRKIVSHVNGAHQGALVTQMDWVAGNGETLIKQDSWYTFRGDANFRSVDLFTTLTAQDDPVIFRDNKDGLLGMRVRRELELPTAQGGMYTDSSGRVTKVDKMDNTGVTGNYLTSEGKTGEAAWGTRGRWCALEGKIGDEPVTIVIFDFPKNPGFPTYWHARDYGLFAANPFGVKDFTNGKEQMNFTIPPHQNVTFHYRILILSKIATADEIEKEYKRFVAAYP
ncbi:MAG: PmoA family protein [Candidatus Acidiferrales bacterium]